MYHNDIREKVYRYLQTPHSKKILLNHYLSVNGLFVNDGKITAYTSSGANLVNKLVHKYLGITNEMIKSEDGNVIEESMNAHKLSLFMEIVNSSLLQKYDNAKN